ncbi:MAG: hypothetical protein NTX53_08220 [candidate division WOR-3 bacterium]|nr:hypothetical protein [candidate division WOR-3 bacterium]
MSFSAVIIRGRLRWPEDECPPGNRRASAFETGFLPQRHQDTKGAKEKPHAASKWLKRKLKLLQADAQLVTRNP